MLATVFMKGTSERSNIGTQISIF